MLFAQACQYITNHSKAEVVVVEDEMQLAKFAKVSGEVRFVLRDVPSVTITTRLQLAAMMSLISKPMELPLDARGLVVCKNSILKQSGSLDHSSFHFWAVRASKLDAHRMLCTPALRRGDDYLMYRLMNFTLYYTISNVVSDHGGNETRTSRRRIASASMPLHLYITP